ncbi:hypothetical protein [Streptosporangium nondiastaticum]|uniref:hypothetical protein n=1 Tax=Streptosporangium nondiastaticum TaxID=35764 RepID=UPI0031F744D0
MIISDHDHDDKINKHCQIHVNKSEQLPTSMNNNSGKRLYDHLRRKFDALRESLAGERRTAGVMGLREPTRAAEGRSGRRPSGNRMYGR